MHCYPLFISSSSPLNSCISRGDQFLQRVIRINLRGGHQHDTQHSSEGVVLRTPNSEHRLCNGASFGARSGQQTTAQSIKSMKEHASAATGSAALGTVSVAMGSNRIAPERSVYSTYYQGHSTATMRYRSAVMARTASTTAKGPVAAGVNDGKGQKNKKRSRSQQTSHQQLMLQHLPRWQRALYYLGDWAIKGMAGGMFVVCCVVGVPMLDVLMLFQDLMSACSLRPDRAEELNAFQNFLLQVRRGWSAVATAVPRLQFQILFMHMSHVKFIIITTMA